MSKILDFIADWLGENWGWIALAGVFVDISPIKFSPIKGILHWVGHKLTGELQEQIAALRADVDAQQKDSILTVCCFCLNHFATASILEQSKSFTCFFIV